MKFIFDLLAEGYVGQVLSTSILGTGGAPWGLDTIEDKQRVYQDKRNGATVLTIPFGHLLDRLIRLFGTLDEPRTTLVIRKPPWTSEARTNGWTFPRQTRCALVGGFLAGRSITALEFRPAQA